ncbi:WD40 domain-containing protein [Streptomyces thinghirensis]|nr:WD40 domain-containing protein [Streptomyces thinghirensis]
MYCTFWGSTRPRAGMRVVAGRQVGGLAAGDGTVIVWDADTGEKHRGVQPQRKRVGLRLQPRRVRPPLGGRGRGPAHVGHRPGRRALEHRRTRGSDPLLHLLPVRHPDGHGEQRRDRCVLRVDTGQVVNILRGHTDRVRACAFSPDGTLLASSPRTGRSDCGTRRADADPPPARTHRLGGRVGVHRRTAGPSSVAAGTRRCGPGT